MNTSKSDGFPSESGIDDALAELLELGVTERTVAKLAELAGVSRQTIYDTRPDVIVRLKLLRTEWRATKPKPTLKVPKNSVLELSRQLAARGADVTALVAENTRLRSRSCALEEQVSILTEKLEGRSGKPAPKSASESASNAGAKGRKVSGNRAKRRTATVTHLRSVKS